MKLSEAFNSSADKVADLVADWVGSGHGTEDVTAENRKVAVYYKGNTYLFSADKALKVLAKCKGLGERLASSEKIRLFLTKAGHLDESHHDLRAKLKCILECNTLAEEGSPYIRESASVGQKIADAIDHYLDKKQNAVDTLEELDKAWKRWDAKALTRLVRLTKDQAKFLANLANTDEFDDDGEPDEVFSQTMASIGASIQDTWEALTYIASEAHDSAKAIDDAWKKRDWKELHRMKVISSADLRDIVAAVRDQDPRK